MKKIKTTDIIAGSAMPLKSGSLDHLQSAYQEDELDMIQMLIAQNDTEINPASLPARIIYGCRRNSSTGAISIGAIVYQNEIFRCIAQNVTLGLGQVVIGTITTTYLTATNADPVVFSDSTSNNVHEIRRITWSAGASGSGDFNFSDLLLYGQWNDVAYNSSYISSPTGTLTMPGGAADWQVTWRQEGRTVWIDFDLEGMTLATANANYLTLSLPFNADFIKEFHSTCYYINPAGSPTSGICIARTIAATNDIRFILPTGQFVVSTGIKVSGQITAELAKADI